MSQPAALPTCPTCAAIRMPGAPMCTQCWTPFEDVQAEPQAPATTATLPATAELSPAEAPDSRFSWAATVPTQPAGPALESTSPPGAPAGWRPVAGSVPTITAPSNRRTSKRFGIRATGLVLVGLLILVLAGGFLWLRSSGQSEEELIADRFRNGRPAGFLPSFPSLGGMGGGLPEAPGDAQAFVAGFDPLVRTANTAMLSLQELLDRWADGKSSDADVRTAIEAFVRDLSAMGQLADRAPESLNRGAAKLSEAAVDYDLALSALLDWLDSRNPGAKATYSFGVADANVHWDEGLIAFYRTTGLPQPELPHPQPKD